MALAVITLVSACDKDDFDADYPSDEIEYDGSRKILVAYFSATGNTQRRAEEIVAATGADVYRIEASEPYASNPYDDSDRIQNESYNNLRPGVGNLPENIDEYDVILSVRRYGGTIRRWSSVRSSKTTTSTARSLSRSLLTARQSISSNPSTRFMR